MYKDFNSWGDQWSQYPYTQQQPPMQQWQNYQQRSQQVPQFQSNKLFVTGPEEALMRSVQSNYLMVCFNQSKPEMYEVRTDAEGRKQIITKYLSDTPIVMQDNITSDYEARLQRLEAILLKPTEKMEAPNE